MLGVGRNLIQIDKSQQFSKYFRFTVGNLHSILLALLHLGGEHRLKHGRARNENILVQTKLFLLLVVVVGGIGMLGSVNAAPAHHHNHVREFALLEESTTKVGDNCARKWFGLLLLLLFNVLAR